MTEPERAALDHIRQVVDSVIGVRNVPDTLPPDPASSIPDTLPADSPVIIPDTLPPDVSTSVLPVPYVSQLGTGAGQIINDSGAAAGVRLGHKAAGPHHPPQGLVQGHVGLLDAGQQAVVAIDANRQSVASAGRAASCQKHRPAREGGNRFRPTRNRRSKPRTL